LTDPEQRFAVRALIARHEAGTARALVRAGAEVRIADIEDEASLARAFAGAYGLYAATDLRAARSAEREAAQGANVARAARTADIRHVVWSTADDAKVEASVIFLEERLATTILQTPRECDRLIRLGEFAFGVFALGLITEVETVIGRTIDVAGEHPGGVETSRAPGLASFPSWAARHRERLEVSPSMRAEASAAVA
jgi:hypothetical protein